MRSLRLQLSYSGGVGLKESLRSAPGRWYPEKLWREPNIQRGDVSAGEDSELRAESASERAKSG